MTKPVSAAALAAPCPSLFSDFGNLAQNLVEAFLAVRGETQRRAAPLTRRTSRSSRCRTRAREMAPRAYHLVLRAIPARRACGATSCSTRDFAFCSIPTMQPPAASCPPRARPDLPARPPQEIAAYRAHVDEALGSSLSRPARTTLTSVAPLIEIGLNHEQQHQELMLTDILHAFAQNPIPPAYDPAWTIPGFNAPATNGSMLNDGIHTVGHADDSFHFDNEKPAHRALVGPVTLARATRHQRRMARLHARRRLRHADAVADGRLAAVEERILAGARHWHEIDGRMARHDASRACSRSIRAPVCHVSYYEADAFARWSGSICRPKWNGRSPRVPASSTTPSASCGNGPAAPTRPIPAIAPIEGALGEYNGKFMVNQLVLRGSRLQPRTGTAVLPIATSFIRHHRWQFTGLRLADYAT